MAKNSAINLEVTNNNDGFDIGGGSTKRKLTVQGGDVGITGSGSSIFTYPPGTTTLVGHDAAQTLSNKSFAAATSGTPAFSMISSGGVDLSSPAAGACWWNGSQLFFYDGVGNRDLLRSRKSHMVALMSAMTPGGTGLDNLTFIVPHASVNGTTPITYNVRRLYFRMETTSSSGNPSIKLYRYTGSGAFGAGTDMMTGGALVMTAGTYEASGTTFSTTQVSSGDKLKVNVIALGATSANWTIMLLLEEN